MGHCLPVLGEGIRKLVGSTLGIVMLLAAASPSLGQPSKLLSIDAFEKFGGLEEAASPVSVSAVLTLAEATGKYRLTVTATIQPLWHIYSITQKSGGPFPSELRLQNVASPSITEWKVSPEPATHVDQQAWPGLPLEEHQGKVSWSVDLSLPERVEHVEGVITVQACKEEPGGRGGQCLQPTDYSFKASLQGDSSSGNSVTPAAPSPAGGTPGANTADALRQSPQPNSDKTLIAPQSPSDGAPNSSNNASATLQDAKVAWRVEIAPGDNDGHYLLTMTPALESGWHVYALESADDPSKVGYKPTLVALESTENAVVSKPAVSARVVQKDLLGDGKMIIPYYPTAPVLQFAVRSDATSKPFSLRGLLGYQTCNDLECLTAAALSFHVLFDPTSRKGEVTLAPAKYGQVSKLVKSGAIPWANIAQPANSTPSAASPLDLRTLGYYLGAAFLAGLMLNFLPCVLPVVGLKVLAFVKQAKEHPMEAVITNVAYVFGMLTVFWIIAGLILWAGYGWGSQFQSTPFRITMLALVWASALSLLGIWDMPVLGFATSTRANQLASQKGYVGSFFKGAFTTLLATPCTGPLLIPVMTWAIAQPAVVIFGVFTMIGLGMGSPFLLVALYPKFAGIVPKPGEWMEVFKQTMGFVMLAFAAWLFSLLSKELAAGTFVFLIGIWVACWLINRVPAGAELGQQIRGWGTAASVAAAAGIFAYNDFQGFKLPWQEFSETRLDQLLKERKTVLVDFTANWCLNCHAIKYSVLDTVATEKALKEANGVPLIADLSEKNPAAESLLERLGNKTHGIPFVAIIPGADPSKAITLSGAALTQANMEKALRRAQALGSSSTASSNVDVGAKRSF